MERIVVRKQKQQREYECARGRWYAVMGLYRLYLRWVLRPDADAGWKNDDMTNAKGLRRLAFVGKMWVLQGWKTWREGSSITQFLTQNLPALRDGGICVDVRVCVLIKNNQFYGPPRRWLTYLSKLSRKRLIERAFRVHVLCMGWLFYVLCLDKYGGRCTAFCNVGCQCYVNALLYLFDVFDRNLSIARVTVLYRVGCDWASDTWKNYEKYIARITQSCKIHSIVFHRYHWYD